MDDLKKNDAVIINGTTLSGIITDINDDGKLIVTLDLGSIMICNPGDVTIIPSESTDHGTDGRFQPGHTPAPLNPDNQQQRVTARSIRNTMLQQLAPYYENIGTYVGQIKAPEKKVDAIAKMSNFVLPALQRVEFSDQTPRDLTEEQRLAEFYKANQAKK